jgi:hypothetical protein
MDMENVRNEQAVALANAAAAQNFELANLSNEQAVRIQRTYLMSRKLYLLLHNSRLHFKVKS